MGLVNNVECKICKLWRIGPGCQALLTDKFSIVDFNGNRHAIKQSILTFPTFDPKDLQEVDSQSKEIHFRGLLKQT